MVIDSFSVVGHEVTHPFRDRSLFFDFEVFSSDIGTVLVNPSTAEVLRAEAGAAGPLESGGLLAGRVFRDTEGIFTAILGAVVAPRKARQYGRLEIPAELTRYLRDECAIRFPSSDVVGWWHSHGSLGQYSQTDLDTQKIFSDPNHVGLLVFTHGDRWAYAYLGPESQPIEITFPGPQKIPRVALPPQSEEAAALAPALAERTPVTPFSVRRRWWTRPRATTPSRLPLVIALFLLVAAGIIFLRPATHPPRSMIFRWSCHVDALGRVVCDAYTNAEGSIRWGVDDAAVSGNNPLTFKMGTRRSVLVSVRFTTKDGSYTDSQRLVR